MHFNAFLMVIPNMVMKFKICEIFEHFATFLTVSSAHACRVVSVNRPFHTIIRFKTFMIAEIMSQLCLSVFKKFIVPPIIKFKEAERTVYK